MGGWVGLTPREEEETVFLAPEGRRTLVVPRSSSWATITAYPPEVRAKVPIEWVGGWVGGWFEWVIGCWRRIEAVGMRYCGLLGGGWVGR